MFGKSVERHLNACTLNHTPVDIPHVPHPALWFSSAALPPPPTAPVLLWLHGGYYLMGTATMHAAPMSAWLKQHESSTMAILSLEYTLTPEAAFPTALQQSACVHVPAAVHAHPWCRFARLPVVAAAWTHPHPRRYGVGQHAWSVPSSPTIINTGGNSAGGNLALATLLTIQVCPTHRGHAVTCCTTTSHPRQAMGDDAAIVTRKTTPDHLALARLVTQGIATHPTPWLQPVAALLVSPRVSSIGHYPPDANQRDMLNLHVLRGASLLHVGLPLPAELDRGMLQGLTPAALVLPEGSRAALGLGQHATEKDVAMALLTHPLSTPLNASAMALARLPPMLVTIGAWCVSCMACVAVWQAHDAVQGTWRRMRRTLRRLWHVWSRQVGVCRCIVASICFTTLQQRCQTSPRPGVVQRKRWWGAGLRIFVE